jgi:secreted trypsin-like serine protease
MSDLNSLERSAIAKEETEWREKQDKHRAIVQAAREYARSLAGDDKVEFIHLFQLALEVGLSAIRTKSVKVDMFSEVMERRINLIPNKFYLESACIENAWRLINRDMDIWGGESADEFPDCVAVGKMSTDFHLIGSGTLINKNAVLTARHCVGTDVSAVYVGPDANNPASGKIYEVEQPSAIHSSEGVPYKNDLAILFLKDKNKKYVEGVNPRARAKKEMIEAVNTVTVAGFGSTLLGRLTGEYGQRLKAKDISIRSSSCATSSDVSNFDCKQGLELVASEHDKGSCNKDSGGPAYVKSGDEWYLAGVASRFVNGSVLCGSGSIYVRVDKYEKWIAEELKKRPPKA